MGRWTANEWYQGTQTLSTSLEDLGRFCLPYGRLFFLRESSPSDILSSYFVIYNDIFLSSKEVMI